MVGAPRTAASPLWRLWGLAWLWALSGSNGEDVLTLTSDNFEATVKANSLILVQFYAPWCGHSKRIAPDYEKAAGMLKGKAPLAKVDATVETHLAEVYKVEGYPTFYFFRQGIPEGYGGGRDAAGFVKFMEDQLGPAARKIDTDVEIEKQIAKRGWRSVFIAKGSEAQQEMFKQLAEKHRSLGIWLLDATLMAEDDPDTIEVHRGVAEVVRLSGADAADADKVLAFITAEMLPAFGEIGSDNFEPYLARSEQGMIWTCFHPDTFKEDALRHMSMFAEVAKSFPQLPAVYTDTKEYEEHVRQELGCRDFPTLVVQLGNLTAGDEAKRYRKLLLAEEMNSQALTSWIQGVLDGKVEEDDGLDELDADDDEQFASEAAANAANAGSAPLHRQEL